MNEEKNYKERLMKMYVKGELPLLKRNEKFNFACVQCGECCRNRDDILLNPFDVFRLRREKKMSLQDFVEKYCEFYTGNTSKLPLMRIQFRPVYELNGFVTGTRCPFLGQTERLYHCRVHKAKPFVCFSYPLGRIEKKDSMPCTVIFLQITVNGSMSISLLRTKRLFRFIKNGRL